MNDERSGPHISLATAFSVECTVPIADLRHYIADEELDRLAEMKSDVISQAFWSSLGAFFGSVAPAIDALAHFNATDNRMGITGLLTVIISAISLSITILAGLMWRSRYRRKQDILEMIRSRPRARVLTE